MLELADLPPTPPSRAEARLGQRTFTSEDAREGLAAFARPPHQIPTIGRTTVTSTAACPASTSSSPRALRPGRSRRAAPTPTTLEDLRVPTTRRCCGSPTAWSRTSSASCRCRSGVAANFRVNGRDHLVPMATEEPSVVAAASNLAQVAREHGGFFCSSSEPLMIAQVQVLDVADPARARRLRLLEHRDELLALANEQDPVLVRFGGGARDIEVRVIRRPRRRRCGAAPARRRRRRDGRQRRQHDGRGARAADRRDRAAAASCCASSPTWPTAGSPAPGAVFDAEQARRRRGRRRASSTPTASPPTTRTAPPPTTRAS